jgi:aryl-alcohol dehydrogenase-like predicted oxidoreductase
VQFFHVNGVRISKIGLGTWQFGSADWAYGDDYAGSEAARIVTRALDLGVNLIDTAEIYGDNYMSELVVGQAIAGRRADALIATKYAPIQPTANVIEAHCRDSARRLGVDQIDLYQFHRPDPRVPYEESVGAIRDLLDEGVIAQAGISNANPDQIAQARTILGGRLASVQNQFSPRFRSSEPELRLCDELGIAFLPWSPLGGIAKAADLGSSYAPFAEIGHAHGVSPQQVALAWELAQSPWVIPIPGSSRPETILDSVRAVDLELSADELATLDATALPA